MILPSQFKEEAKLSHMARLEIVTALPIVLKDVSVLILLVQV